MRARVVLIAKTLHEELQQNYKKDIKLILKTLDQVRELDSFWIWPLTTYVELFGLDDLELSARAMEEMTKRFSSEFVIRHFLNTYPKEMYSIYLKKWVTSKDEHLRRLVSEGTRPNLPWGIKFEHIEKYLKKNIIFLNKLRKDSSLYVRKSVANHLNDISYIAPDLMLDTLTSWKNKSKEEEWIIRHASRTLLKKGHPKALELNGFSIQPKVKLLNEKISKKSIREGESFDISFSLQNLSKKNLKLSIDYVIYYPKKNGELSPKVFKLKDIDLEAEAKIDLKKKVPFKKVTTRKHYPGKHKMELKVSDRIFKFHSFNLKV